MKKRLIIAKDIIVEKTFEEVYQDFQPLIMKNINDWSTTYEADDIKSICEFYLWKAYDRYDIHKNIGFAHYVNIVVGHGLLDNLKRYWKHSDEDSLNVTATFEDGFEGTEMLYMLKDDTDYSEVAVNELFFENVKKILTDKENKIFEAYYVRGLKRCEISRELSLNRNSVSRILCNIEEKARNLFNGVITNEA